MMHCRRMARRSCFAAVPVAAVLGAAAAHDHRLGLVGEQLAQVGGLAEAIEPDFEQVGVARGVEHVREGQPTRFLVDGDADHDDSGDGIAPVWQKLPQGQEVRMGESAKSARRNLISITAEAFMRNPIPFVVAASAVAASFVAAMLLGWPTAFAQDRPMTKPFVEVPDTVSPQARKYLESLPDPETLPAWPAPDDAAGWKRLWEANEAASRAKAEATMEGYRPTVAERTLGGVAVLDIKPKGWKDNGKVLVHAHGGAYTMNSASFALAEQRARRRRDRAARDLDRLHRGPGRQVAEGDR